MQRFITGLSHRILMTVGMTPFEERIVKQELCQNRISISAPAKCVECLVRYPWDNPFWALVT